VRTGRSIASLKSGAAVMIPRHAGSWRTALGRARLVPLGCSDDGGDAHAPLMRGRRVWNLHGVTAAGAA